MVITSYTTRFNNVGRRSFMAWNSYFVGSMGRGDGRSGGMTFRISVMNRAFFCLEKSDSTGITMAVGHHDSTGGMPSLVVISSGARRRLSAETSASFGIGRRSFASTRTDPNWQA